MPSDDTKKAIANLDEKIEALSDSVNDIAAEMKALSEVPEITKAVDTLSAELKKIKKDLEPVSKLDEIIKSVSGIASGIDDLKKTSKDEELDKKADELAASVAALHSAFKTSIEQDEPQLLVKKIDELQQYIADLSGIEEKISEIARSFEETREIVSIIVRQLDDVERKYNKALEEVSKALEEMTKAAEAAPRAELPPRREKPKKEKPKKEEPEEPEEPEPLGVEGLPATVDDLMDKLLKMVTAQTEAVQMATALEDTRDQLTTMIEEHTPVIYQFGKRARELKSYPPTATLNENDIARLNKEIREWAVKLREITRPD
ncbi:MAG: hypothetical protein JSW61_11585 [Candidatus Thorarchaeota archaeon]|nr:MAG: hypothetical protein JSW61_11585 [Candidatus Thorarchaeota archaeon]